MGAQSILLKYVALDALKEKGWKNKQTILSNNYMQQESDMVKPVKGAASRLKGRGSGSEDNKISM